MKFLSDILAKAGLTVDGVVTLNNTATGQTPSANDNSTKLATTAWVRTFVQPYNLPIASGTTLGGVKIGSGLTIDGTGIVSVAASGVGAIRALQQITATAGQTVFTVSGGYTPGLIDVFLNGVLLTPTAIDATNGNSFTLADAAVLNDLLDVFVYNPIYNGFISSTDQVPEGIVNLYYTNTRARSAISLTVTGTSGASTYDSGTGVLNVPTYSLSGLGGVPTSRTITIDGVTFDLTANRTWTILPTGGAAGDILAKTSATNYAVAWIPNYTSQVQHYVKLGEAMTIGTAVYVSGTTGNAGTNMIVSKASNASEPTSSKTIGLLASSGAQNDIVFVVTEGLVSGIDTSTAIAGDPVWLGVNGQLIYGLLNKPNAPQHLVFIGIVTRVQQVNGEIFVKVQNGFELHELHNVSALNPTDGDMIKYVASTGLWTKIAATTNNITEGTNLYYTDGRVSTYLTANGYATQTYVNTAVSNLVASAPSTLDTLNELAAALGNDPSFATTVATSIGGKLSLTGGTLTGILNLNNATSNRINFGTNGVATPTFTTYSNGVKIILYDSLGASALGYTIGIDAGTLFNTLPAADAGMFFKWYGGTTVAASLGGTGIFTAASLVKSGGIASEILAADGSVITAGSGILISGGLISSTALGGVTSFNTRTGAITLSSTDITTALTYTPVTNARTLTINGTAYDLTADRSWTVGVNPSARAIETFTATASQTTFTVTGGYVVGLVDVFINGVRLTSVDYTATNGSTIVLSTGTGVGNIVDIVKYTSAFIANNALRQTTYFTATAGQTTFTISYSPGLVDVFYNGSKLASTEYTALNGTSIVLSTAASLNDVIEVTAYTYSVGAYSGQAQLNGTGLVRMSGTTVSYDNNTYLTTSSASSTYLPLIGGTLTGALTGTSSVFSSSITVNALSPGSFKVYVDGDVYGSTGFYTRNSASTFIGSSNNTSGINVNGTTGITQIASGGNYVATFANNGTATFTGPTVTIGSAVAATNVKLLINGVASKAAGIEFQQGGTAQWYLGNGIASEDNNFELYNSNGTMAMKIIKSTNAINFIGNITGTGSVTVVNGIYTLPALTPSYFGYSGYGVLIVGNSNSAQTRSIAFNVDVSGNPSGAFSGYGSEYIWRNAGSFITPNSVNNGYNTLLSWNSAGLVTFNQETIFNSTTTVAGNGVYGNGRTANSAGTTLLNIMGSSSSSTSAQLNLTQVWNGVQYPIVLKNIYNPTGGAASSVFTLSTTQWNGSIPLTTERFRIDGNDGIITIGDTLGYTTAQKGQFFSKGGGGMFTANLLSGGWGRHFTMQRNDSTKWHIGVDGSDNFGLLDSADSFIMTLTGAGIMTTNTYKSNVTPGSPTLDSSGSFVTLGNGSFVDFPGMSGMILVNNTGTGALQVFICGGGNTASLGSVVNTTGTMTHSPSVGGYRFTNNTGSTWTFAFQVFKTRGTA